MDVKAAARPRFKSCFDPIIDCEDGLFLLCEDRHAWMPERIYADLAPLLDGAHDVETIFGLLSDTYSSADVFAALDKLRKRGYLAGDTAALPRPEQAFWERADVHPARASSRLSLTSVSTLAFGDVQVSCLNDLLCQQGITLDAEGSLRVVVTDHYLQPELAQWNKRSLASGQPWLLVKPIGIQTWIGPAFVPGQTACWECLAHRLRWHHRLERYIRRRNGNDGRSSSPPVGLPVSSIAVLAEVATEVTRWIGTGGDSVLADQVVTTNVLTFERAHHKLIRRPQCLSCGSPEPLDGTRARPMNLQARLKVYTSDGGHRARDPREVNRQLEHHLSPITGIVGVLETGQRTGPTVSGGDWLTPTFAADHNFSDMHDERFFLREGMRRRSGGKGKHVEQARASALAESLERYSGVFDSTEPRIRTSFTELGEVAIPPNACMGYSEQQFTERASRNLKEHKAHWVPEPFQEDVEIDWTPLWSLNAEETRYLPTSYCYFGYRHSDPVFARADSNGCAAGSVLEEAVLQGLLELIERDAVALWWYNRLRRPALELAGIEDAYVSGLLDHYRRLRRDLWALDITSDFGIPTFAALSRRVDKPEEDIIYGFGCHLDPGVALTRALTELNQSLEAVPAATGLESADTYRGDADAVHWWRSVKAADSTYLVPDPAAVPNRLSDLETLASDDLYVDIQTCVSRAASLDIDVLVLDQTRPDVGFPVVRVVAPGLRHFWARFGPGRLYDVPMNLGWLEHPLTEGELNPFVIQF